MRLIFITRIVDRRDTRSGFIFDWIEAFAKHLDHLYVICQEKREVGELPRNVELHSFGKERGYGRFRQLFILLSLFFTLSKNSSGILAHMHSLYAIIAWLPARLREKKLALWYTHDSVTLLLRIAHALVNTVFTASSKSIGIHSPKVRVVGHGIKVERFSTPPKTTPQNGKFRIVAMGRISPSKNYETLLHAVSQLPSSDYEVHIYGNPALPEDAGYLRGLQELTKELKLQEVVSFHPGVPYEKTSEVYVSADLFVNLRTFPSVDKTVLEASASRTVVLTSNEAFLDPLGKISLFLVTQGSPKAIAGKIAALRDLSKEERGKIQDELCRWVEREHSLNALVQRIVGEFS